MTDASERVRPQRIRITKLQETQVSDLVELEKACTAMYHDLGFDAAEVPPRTWNDIAHLPRHHNVFVAEADHEVAGYLAWRDESPGVAYLEELSVHPRFQRFGVGTRLLQRFEEDALNCERYDVIARMFEKATWAQAFYAHHGFAQLGDQASRKVLGWREERSGGRPLTRPGEVLIWKSFRAQ
ncbi:GNAT family N-acetyltransferase [Polyangium jinanense]|uniref:GNAT family N-acetyltransferase n=1 Tax=Polyangium jinanense TaxID=2829994 RepID=A0A9X4ASS0_9BACT|nr:GNAT family N-acetyltransferase [Polyangium jinanense]MDC3957930.1 GNAT family N-acetyltransferase [Polyangium jinanense]MDC3961971.1 GNAT family N-acetyltransferase [Polyangium jinanense]MDC3983483.1 GNAT family N-acetyltransferase [Polyangium jinanense]